jgi:hypothetical protein
MAIVLDHVRWKFISIVLTLLSHVVLGICQGLSLLAMADIAAVAAMHLAIPTIPLPGLAGMRELPLTGLCRLQFNSPLDLALIQASTRSISMFRS